MHYTGFNHNKYSRGTLYIINLYIFQSTDCTDLNLKDTYKKKKYNNFINK